MTILEPAITATSRTGSWLISELRAAGALTPETAQPIRLRNAGMDYILAQLLKTGIVGEATKGRYYLDERVLAPLERRARLWRLAVTILGIGLVVSVVVRFLLRFL
jgi:hypothetical protein